MEVSPYLVPYLPVTPTFLVLYRQPLAKDFQDKTTKAVIYLPWTWWLWVIFWDGRQKMVVGCWS